MNLSYLNDSRDLIFYVDSIYGLIHFQSSSMHTSHNHTIRRDHSHENNFEESKSEHSFEDKIDAEDDIILDYHSTNLITRPNIYVSDVHLETVSLNTL